ncbi:phosphotransferase family protein [Alkalicoccobacillus murimartini]|uniref:Aminoglycoside phosphotransferase domain-containing protein n=1 Tax=Alkalicoccobacillus murimartini TaxID=171685 RepID=A0ABT9YI11_9BACI|nr:phosphotransferase [Alkalicoccobacillus murimartini]MDQ0207498.1 hypothetical protein [Alkalicoccobacillus murimartini]
MVINEIMNELKDKEIINSSSISCEPLSGGTVSELYLLTTLDGARYVVKLNESHVLQSEVHFLACYKHLDLLPHLLYVDPSYQYIVYTFISGSTNGPKSKRDMLKVLVQGLINNYTPVPIGSGWGWVDDVTDSWEQFLLSEVNEANTFVNSHLGEGESIFVRNLVKKKGRAGLDRKAVLLHGDCGVHNFIFEDGDLKGVIDPTPVIGEPLYDLLYAFCSSSDDLTKETILSAANPILIKENISEQLLFEDVFIVLYLRLAICSRHHPDDLPNYLDAFFTGRRSSQKHIIALPMTNKEI